MNEKDYYRVLGVERGAPGASIKEAYRRLAFEYHPDRNRGDAAAVERMKEINEAYAVLSDPGKRQRYDALRQEYGSHAYDHFRRGYSDQDIFRNSDINQVFEEMAKAFGFRNFDEVFRESYGKTYQTYEFRRPGMFGKFIIIKPGQRRRTSSQEAVTTDESREGDGFLGRLASSAVRYLAGRMLGTSDEAGPADHRAAIEISPEQAEKGGRVPYGDPVTARQITINIPAGIREGQVLRLRGMGAANRFGQRGDLYLTVRVKRSLLEKLKSLFSGKE
jgi:DnaJ-class molecular chaperone